MVLLDFIANPACPNHHKAILPRPAMVVVTSPSAPRVLLFYFLDHSAKQETGILLEPGFLTSPQFF